MAKKLKVCLSIVVGLAALFLIMAAFAGMGTGVEAAPHKAVSAAGSQVLTVTVGATPTVISVGGDTSTLTATVEGEGGPVTDTFVIFSPTLGSITANPYAYVEAEGDGVTRWGTWEEVEDDQASGGAYLRSATAGSKLFYSFNGTAVGVIYTAHPDGGIVNFRVGAYTTTLDTYSPTVQWKKHFLVAKGLAPGSHVLEAEVTGTGSQLRALAEPGYYIFIDAFESGTTTDAHGVATATLTSGYVAGVCTVTATADSVTGTTAITITPDVPAELTASAEPAVIATGGATSTITAVVRDQYGNDVADGTVVTFTTDLGTWPNGARTYTSTTSGGVATATLTSGIIEGTATVTATAGAAGDSTQVDFVLAQPEEPGVITVTADPAEIPIGGYTSTITATVKDYWGTPVDETVVTFTTDLGTWPNGARTYTSATSPDGVATAVLESGIVEGTANVTVAADSISATTQVTFTIVPCFDLDVTPTERTVAAGEETSYTVSATSLHGFTSPITLAISGLPAGATADFDPNPITPAITSTLTVETSSSTPSGTYTLTIEGESGDIRDTVTATLFTSSPPHYTFYLPIIRKGWQGWDTGFMVQNLGDETAQVLVKFYDPDGITPVCTVLTGVEPGQAQTFYQPSMPDISLPPGRYSAVVDADQPIAVVANQVNYDLGLGDSYQAISQVGPEVYLPLVFCGHAGWYSTIVVQNADERTVVAEVTLHREGESPLLLDTLVIPRGAAREVAMASAMRALAGELYGSVVISADGDVAAVVNQVKAIPGSCMLIALPGQAVGAEELVAPLVYKNYSTGWVSGIQVQNLGETTTDVEMIYMPTDASGSYTETQAASPEGYVTFYIPDCPDIPDHTYGAARIRADQLIAAIVQETNYTHDMASGYLASSAGSRNVAVPLWFKRYSTGWDTGIQVYNLGDEATDVSVQFAWEEGGGGTATWEIEDVAPGTSETFYLPGYADIPEDTHGSAVVTADQPIVVVVNNANYDLMVLTCYSGFGY